MLKTVSEERPNINSDPQMNRRGFLVAFIGAAVSLSTAGVLEAKEEPNKLNEEVHAYDVATHIQRKRVEENKNKRLEKISDKIKELEKQEQTEEVVQKINKLRERYKRVEKKYEEMEKELDKLNNEGEA